MKKKTENNMRIHKTYNGDIIFTIWIIGEKQSLPGGLEPPTFRLTAERAGQLRHGSLFSSLKKNI